MKKSVLILITILVGTLFGLQVYATDAKGQLSLGVTQAVKMAKENSIPRMELVNGTDQMRSAYNKISEGTQALKSMYENLSRYKILALKVERNEQITASELQLYYYYQMFYGPDQPDLLSSDTYTNYVEPTEVQAYERQNTLENQDLILKSLDQQLEYQVKALYMGIQAADNISQQLDIQVANAKLAYDDILLKAKAGQVDAITVQQLLVSYESIKYEANQTKRSLANNKNELKKICGIDIDSEIILTDRGIDTLVTKPLTFEAYKALYKDINIELQQAELALDLKSYKYKAMKNYFPSNSVELTDVKNQIDLDSLEVERVTRAVESKSRDLYDELITKRDDLSDVTEKLTIEQKRIGIYTSEYRLGRISLTDLRKLDSAYELTRLAYFNALLSYQSALYNSLTE